MEGGSAKSDPSTSTQQAPTVPVSLRSEEEQEFIDAGTLQSFVGQNKQDTLQGKGRRRLLGLTMIPLLDLLGAYDSDDDGPPEEHKTDVVYAAPKKVAPVVSAVEFASPALPPAAFSSQRRKWREKPPRKREKPTPVPSLLEKVKRR